MLQAIQSGWATDNGFADYLAVITAAGGHRKTGRRSRPDVTVVARHRYKFVPVRELEVIAFEIKHAAQGLDVAAVYEALAHRCAATGSFLVIYAPEPVDEDLASAMNDILLPEAEEHGIGLVLTADPANYGSWNNRATAERVQPALRSSLELGGAKIQPMERGL